MSRTLGKVTPDELAERYKDKYLVHYDVKVENNEIVDDFFRFVKVKSADDFMHMSTDTYRDLARNNADDIAYDTFEDAQMGYALKQREMDLPISVYTNNLSDEEVNAVHNMYSGKKAANIYHYDKSDDTPVDTKAVTERLSNLDLRYADEIEPPLSREAVDISELDLPY